MSICLGRMRGEDRKGDPQSDEAEHYLSVPGRESANLNQLND